MACRHGPMRWSIGSRCRKVETADQGEDFLVEVFERYLFVAKVDFCNRIIARPKVRETVFRAHLPKDEREIFGGRQL